MSNPLLLSRRFAPLFWRQFFAAFNDNYLKNAVVLTILFKIGGEAGASLVTIAGVVFIAPYFVFSALGGELADKYDKAMIARRLSLIEIGAAGVALAGFWLASIPILMLGLFLFGLIGALFAPVKYGVLPDLLAREDLVAGNALVEGATFLAILTGSIVGGLAAQRGDLALLSAGMLAVAVASYAAAWFIPPIARAAPDLPVDPNLLRSTLLLLRELWRERPLWRAGVVTSIFWLIGAVVMSLAPTLIKDALNGSEAVVTVHLAIFAVAIGVGSGLAAMLLHGKIVLLPTAVGALIVAATSGDVGIFLLAHAPQAAAALEPAAYFEQPGAIRIAVDLGLIAVAGGLMIVPSFAAVQAFSNPAERARLVAAVNVLNAAFMVGGGALVALFQSYGVGAPELFLGLGALGLLSAVWIVKAVVASPLRDFLAIFFRSFYRLEMRGLENLDKAGPNPIIALNHVSFLDAALALAILPKDPVFAIDQTIAQVWWVRPFLHFVRAIPLDPTRPMGVRALVNSVKAGDPLVIFPEGRLTVTGSLMKVYDGAGLIADKSGALIVPIRIEGPEATIFSRLSRAQVRRRFLPKFRLTVLEPVRLQVDEKLKGKARRHALGSALYQIMSDLVFRTTDVNRTLFQAVCEAAREHGAGRVALQDPIGGKLTYRKLLIGARALGEKFAQEGAPGEAVGLMLPNANAAAVALLALVSAGRVAAMINFTAGASNILAGCAAAKVERIVTSRAFIEKARLDKLIAALQEKIAIVYLEDLRETISAPDRLRAFLLRNRPVAARKPDDPVAILFTSGTEGAPKGVVLSHRNILANAAQAAARIDFGRADKVFDVLPLFHSFGLTVGFVLPLISGVPIYLYPSPLHYRTVPELVYGANATILFGTDTFLSGYGRSANAYDFRSIRYVVAGAEPVKETTRQMWCEKFGIRILEGYGVTETSPVLALNTPMFNKFGTVGRLMPGVEARLEPITGVLEGGRLLVRGPNVMLGYLKADRPGEIQPPSQGWHDTGDIVSIDAEGFVTIKGRAKRFAKVGGEMVSLAAVEALASSLWPRALSAAATEIDPRKGERIVLVTNEKNAMRADFAAFAKSRGAADLMVPAEILVVDALPLLGSGKLDLAAVTRMVRDRGRYMLSTPRLPNGLRGRINGETRPA